MCQRKLYHLWAAYGLLMSLVMTPVFGIAAWIPILGALLVTRPLFIAC